MMQEIELYHGLAQWLGDQVIKLSSLSVTLRLLVMQPSWVDLSIFYGQRRQMIFDFFCVLSEEKIICTCSY